MDGRDVTQPVGPLDPLDVVQEYRAPTPENYREEADRIIRILEDSGSWPGGPQFSSKDLQFVRGLKSNPTRPVSRKMIFWLRDLKDKTL